jgi:Uma2 family endonuclease
MVADMAPLATTEASNSALLRDSEALYEVVNGEMVALAPMGAHDVWLASFLSIRLGGCAQLQNLGYVVVEMLFELGVGLQRRPDVAYVSYQRWPRRRRIPRTNAWTVVPELAVEVVSLTNTFEEVVGKVSEYFTAGVQRVWIITPAEQRVYVYEPPAQIKVLTVQGELRDEFLLPGFSLSLAELCDSQAEAEVS